MIHCQLFQDNQVQPIEFEAISDHVGQDDRFIWVELKSPDSQLITRLGEELGLHGARGRHFDSPAR